MLAKSLFACHKYVVYKTQVCCLCVTSMLFACHKAVGKRQNDGGSGGHRRTAQETTDMKHVTFNMKQDMGEWYTLDGRKLGKKPTAKGVYVKDGRKVVIK